MFMLKKKMISLIYLFIHILICKNVFNSLHFIDPSQTATFPYHNVTVTKKQEMDTKNEGEIQEVWNLPFLGRGKIKKYL